MTAPPLGSGELLALAEKYRALLDLRRRRDAGLEPPTRETLRALSRAYPGSLRELDTLGGDELARRAAALAAAAGGGPEEPWDGVDRRLPPPHARGPRNQGRDRPALPRPKLPGSVGVPFLPGRARLSDEALAPWVERAGALAGWPLDAAAVRALAQPPQGRIGPVVLTLLGALSRCPRRPSRPRCFPRAARRRIPWVMSALVNRLLRRGAPAAEAVVEEVDGHVRAVTYDDLRTRAQSVATRLAPDGEGLGGAPIAFPCRARRGLRRGACSGFCSRAAPPSRCRRCTRRPELERLLEDAAPDTGARHGRPPSRRRRWPRLANKSCCSIGTPAPPSPGPRGPPSRRG